MNHSTIKEKLFDFYDEELPETEAVLIRTHLEICSECRGTMEDWASVARSFFVASPVHTSEAFVSAVMARVEPERFSFSNWLMPAFGFGFAALALFFAMSHLNPVSTEELLFNESTANSAPAPVDVLALLQS